MRFFKRAAIAILIRLAGGEFIFSTAFAARILFEALQILVTHAWHIKQAESAFAANGLVVKAAPTAFYRPGRFSLLNDFTPSLAALSMSGYAAHEIVGSMWYALKYGY